MTAAGGRWATEGAAVGGHLLGPRGRTPKLEPTGSWGHPGWGPQLGVWARLPRPPGHVLRVHSPWNGWTGRMLSPPSVRSQRKGQGSAWSALSPTQPTHLHPGAHHRLWSQGTLRNDSSSSLALSPQPSASSQGWGWGTATCPAGTLSDTPPCPPAQPLLCMRCCGRKRSGSAGWRPLSQRKAGAEGPWEHLGTPGRRPGGPSF